MISPHYFYLLAATHSKMATLALQTHWGGAAQSLGSRDPTLVCLEGRTLDSGHLEGRASTKEDSLKP